MDSVGQSSIFFDEQLFLEMEEIAKSGMYAYDVQNQTFKASPHFQKMFRLSSQASYRGEVFQSLIHPEDKEWVMQFFAECISEHKPFNCEYRCLIEGEIMHVSSRSRIEYDDQGQAVRVLGVKRDISEQKQAEEEEQRTDEKYLLALRHSPVVFARVDTDLRYEWIFNPHTDFEAESVKGKRDDELANNSGTQALVALKRRTLEENKQLREQIAFDVSEGSRTFDITATPLRNEAGKATGLITASLDITEQQATESALQSSEIKLSIALRASRSGIYDLPLQGDAPPEVAGGAKKLFGFAKESQPAMEDFVQRVHPEDQERVAAAIEKSIQEKEGHYIEYRVVHPDGKELWLASRTEYLTGEKGHFPRLIGTLIDISERKRDELVLQQSRELARQRLEELENIYDTTPVGLCVLDKDLRFVRINQALAEINGFTIEEHIGKTVRELMPKLADDAEPALLDVVNNGKPIHNIEITSETPSQPGVLRTWIESWLPYKNQLGEIIGVNIVAEEVTEKRKNEEIRQEKEDRFRRLFNAIDDGFCVCELLLDEDGQARDYRFLEVNHNFENHTGLKDAAGKTALDLVPNLEQHWFDTYGSVALEGKSIRFEQGSEEMGRWFDVYAFPFGKPESLVFAIQFKDVTERKQRENVLRDTQKKLASANQELETVNEELRISNEDMMDTNDKLTRVNADLDNFVYTASHDLKAPITNLHNLQEMLQTELRKEESTLSPVAQKILQMMESSVERFMQTIADMTDITRLQKQGDLPTEQVDIAQVIEDVSADLTIMIEQSEAEVDSDVSQCSRICYVPKNLRSIVYNLLSNAIKYRHPDRSPHVKIRCESTEEYQVLTVSDNGLGIDIKQQDRLFGMFQRLHDHVEGTGIGLYIVKRMVENAGGKIGVESEVGKGSTFKIFFRR